MGKKAIMFVLLFVIIAGTVIINMNKKQLLSIAGLSDLVYQKQARYLANSLAKIGAKEMQTWLMDNNHVSFTPAIRPDVRYKNLPSFQDSENSVVNLTFYGKPVVSDGWSNTFHGAELNEGQWGIEAIAMITDAEGMVHTAQTDVYFTFETNVPYMVPNINWDTITGIRRIFVVLEENTIVIYTAEQYYSFPSTYFYETPIIVLRIPIDNIPEVGDLGKTLLISGKFLESIARPGNSDGDFKNVITFGMQPTQASTNPPAYIRINYSITLIFDTNIPIRIGSHLNTQNNHKIKIYSKNKITTNHIPNIQAPNVEFYSMGSIAEAPVANSGSANGWGSEVPITPGPNQVISQNLADLGLPHDISNLEKKYSIKAWSEKHW